jgi:hypothetical protein
MKGLIPADQNRDERYAEMAQSGTVRPSNLTILNSPNVVVGPMSQILSLLHISGYDGAIICASKP